MSEYQMVALYAELMNEARAAVDKYERERYEHIVFDTDRAYVRPQQEARYIVAFRSEKEARSALVFLEKAPRLISELSQVMRLLVSCASLRENHP